ncbi:MAG: hypothetical protein IJF61_04550 [Clostridia bacterium]|nr:hypothetical protein [Clostridia bacterium]
MDVFLEYLMHKKPDKSDIVKQLGIVFAAFIACVIVLLLFVKIEFVRPYVFLALAGVVYFSMIFMRNFNLEYEYIFTNGELDIDVVKARTTRKRMTSLKCINIELMASDNNEVYKNDFKNGNFSNTFNAVFDASQGRVYHVIFSNQGERNLLSFQPPVKLLAAMKKMNPRNIYVDEADVVAEETPAE